MTEINAALREHTTSIAFQLTLSKSMIALLVIVHYFKGDVKKVLHSSKSSHFVTSMRCLRDRGLLKENIPVYSKTRISFGGGPIIERCKPYRLTKAGTLVIGLLKEAGLYQDVVSGLKLYELFKEEQEAESA